MVTHVGAIVALCHNSKKRRRWEREPEFLETASCLFECPMSWRQDFAAGLAGLGCLGLLVCGSYLFDHWWTDATPSSQSGGLPIGWTFVGVGESSMMEVQISLSTFAARTFLSSVVGLSL